MYIRNLIFQFGVIIDIRHRNVRINELIKKEKEMCSIMLQQIRTVDFNENAAKFTLLIFERSMLFDKLFSVFLLNENWFNIKVVVRRPLYIIQFLPNNSSWVISLNHTRVLLESPNRAANWATVERKTISQE